MGAAPAFTSAALCLALIGLHFSAAAQAPAQPAPAAPPAITQPPPAVQPPAAVQPQSAASAAAPPRAPGKSAAAKANGRQAPATSPLWRELNPAEQQSLAPLAASWETMSVAQKRKWLALSQNFPRMSQEEQQKLHSRMTEWAALSPQQRTQARLNFGVTRQISPDDKKAQWEAYQALPPEEKRKLAASAAKPPATAAAIRPVAPERLTAVPKPKSVSPTPRIDLPPGRVDNKTLLPPARPAASAPGRAG